jgi:DNA polymerase-1
MVIDGHSLAFRAFYALPVDSFQNSAGQHTNAIHGFISMLINLLQNENPEAIAVAFDISRHSFRTEEYPEYKGTRKETPEEFKGQIPLLQEALHAMGIVTLEKENYEADDILATLSRAGAENGYRVLVVSGDRDTIQLVNDDVLLLYPSKQGVRELTRYDEAAVRERYGVAPEQYPEIAALVGETSDNLPGVPKVGEKTAVKWLDRFGSLDEILRRKDEITGKVGESLREHAENAVRNRRLNRLVTDVDLNVSVSDLKRNPINMDDVAEVFAKLEFRTLLKRLAKLTGQEEPARATASPGQSDQQGRDESEEDDTLPEPLHLIDEELGAWLKRVERPAVQFDVVFRESGEPQTPIPVGVATAKERVDFNWQPGGRDYADFEAWLESTSEKVFWDAKRASRLALTCGLELDGVKGDALLAAWLLRPNAPEKTLEDAVYRFLGESLSQPDPNQLVPESQTEVSEVAWFIFRVHDAILEHFQGRTHEVYENIEIPLVPVLARLEHRGVEIDTPVLEAQLAEVTDRVHELEQDAFEAIGREVNLASPKQLQDVLFNQLNMPKTRKTKSGYTTDASALAELQITNPHPFLEALLGHRDANKLRQIIEGLLKSVYSDGRIHTTFEQIGASTGRMASSDPNLQNIPIRSEAGRRIREGFTHASSFDTLMTADYSQIEMRIMADLSQDEGLIEAFKRGEDLHRFVGSRIFGVSPEDVTSEMRSKVKAMSYGLAYGLSAFGLSKQLGISAAEAKQLMQDYFARFGGVRDYLREVVEQAKDDGYTETVFGRRRPFPELSSPNRVLRQNAERAALNAPIQGTAADIIKIAMVRIDERMRSEEYASRMLLQIHDELMFEVVSGELNSLTKLVREEMERAELLSVPLEVSVGQGENWNTAGH